MPAPQVTPWMRPGALQHAMQHASRPPPSPTARSCGCGPGRSTARAPRAPDGCRRRSRRRSAPHAARGACGRDRSAGSCVPAIEAVGVDAGERADRPAAAQAPELSPFDTEIPFPPSTSGRTSRPEITSGFSGSLDYSFSSRRPAVATAHRPLLPIAMYGYQPRLTRV